MVSILLYILFVIAAIVLVVVVLLQEGRGGGFGEALGSHGRETFGVGSKGINTFTGWTAGVFLATALLLHWVNRVGRDNTVLNKLAVPEQAAPTPGGQPSVTPVEMPPQTPPQQPVGDGQK